MNRDTELLPCPFCGSANIVKRSGRLVPGADEDTNWLACMGCDATGPSIRKRQDEDDPEWNQRHLPQAGSGGFRKNLVYLESNADKNLNLASNEIEKAAWKAERDTLRGIIDSLPAQDVPTTPDVSAESDILWAFVDWMRSLGGHGEGDEFADYLDKQVEGFLVSRLAAKETACDCCEEPFPADELSSGYCAECRLPCDVQDEPTNNHETKR